MTGRSVSTCKVVAIIPAAGSGVRMGSDRPKQFLELGGKPLLAVTLSAFQDCRAVDAVVLVVPRQEVEWCREQIVARFGLRKVKQVVPGGARRQDSVRLGLEAAGEGYGLVMVHDGARPVIDKKFIARMIDAGRLYPAVIAAMPAVETVKEVDDQERVVSTCRRERVWLVQTPQVFRHDLLLKAHQRAVQEQWEGCTDDSLLMERLGVSVKVVEGLPGNIKVTTPYDLKLAHFLLGLDRAQESQPDSESGSAPRP